MTETDFHSSEFQGKTPQLFILLLGSVKQIACHIHPYLFRLSSLTSWIPLQLNTCIPLRRAATEIAIKSALHIIYFVPPFPARRRINFPNGKIGPNTGNLTSGARQIFNRLAFAFANDGLGRVLIC